MTTHFHEQLLHFFQEDLQRRKEEEGWDEQIDPEIRTFSDELSRAVRDTNYSLEKLVGLRQHLLATRPIHLEFQLFRLFPESLMRKLQLPPLQIIRGIPRLYYKSNLSLSKLAISYADLKKKIALRSLWFLYDQMPVPKNVRINLVGNLPLASMAKEIILENFPYLEVDVLSEKEGFDLTLTIDHNFGFGFHFLEQGILIPSMISVEAKQNFYVADLQTPLGLSVYLHALPPKVEVCVLDRELLLRTLRQNPDLGERFSFIVPEKPLISGELHTLIAQSAGIVGCGSDASLSCAIAQNKLFFYEGSHLKDLLALAENRLPLDRNLNQILRFSLTIYAHQLEEGDWIDEIKIQEEFPLDLGTVLQNIEVQREFQRLCHIIKENYSCNQFLFQLIQRAISHQRRPKLAQREEELFFQFLKNKISFSAMIEEMRDALF